MPFSESTAWCGEVEGYPIQIMTQKGPLTHRCLHVLYSDLSNWLSYFISNPTDPYAGSTLPPLLIGFRAEPEKSQKILQSAPPGIAMYQVARLYLEYSGIGTFLRSGVVLQEKIETGYEAFQVPGDGLTWADDSSQVQDFSPTLHMPVQHYSVYFPFASSEGSGSVVPGNVNSASFSSYVLSRTFAAGTLLFIGLEEDIAVTWTGSGSRYSKRYLFKWRPYDWNTHYHPKTQTWTNLKDGSGTTYNQYPPVNFGTLG